MRDLIPLAYAPAEYAGHPGALAMVLRHVKSSGYRFTTVTPATQQRVLARRAGQQARDLRDVFGWNLPFAAGLLEPAILEALRVAGALHENADLFTSRVRVSTLGTDAFLHSGHPTRADDAVFFGPDTCRFARFIGQAMHSGSAYPPRILDVGCGSGAGGIAAARAWMHGAGPLPEVTMADINPLALAYAAINAQVAGVPVVLAEGDALAAVAGAFDLIVSNPPYLVDAARRAYRHGGARMGRALSARIALEALPRLAPGGQLLLYTGVAILRGHDPLLAELAPVLDASGCDWSYSELDPDVFGEELQGPAYADAERIAAVGLAVRRPGGGR